MTYATDDLTKQSLEKFKSFDVDTQLALLWFGYLDIKDQLTPANAETSQESAGGLYDRIRVMPQEAQLQAQRDIVGCVDSEISYAYRSVSSSGKLDLWLRLAQGMEEGVIIQVPSDYELPAETKDFVDTVTKLDFEQRLNFMRSEVVEMGAK